MLHTHLTSVVHVKRLLSARTQYVFIKLWCVYSTESVSTSGMFNVSSHATLFVLVVIQNRCKVLEVTKTPTKYQRYEEGNIFAMYVPLYLYKHWMSIRLHVFVSPEIEKKINNISLMEIIPTNAQIWFIWHKLAYMFRPIYIKKIKFVRLLV